MLFWVFFLGVLATACTSKGNWKHTQIEGASAQFSSHRLIYRPSHTSNPLCFEIIRTSSSCKGYLFVEQKPIPPHEQDPKKALLSIHIDGTSKSHIITRYEDGYRLALPKELLNALTQALEQGKSITIQAAGYTTVLSSEGFLAHYKQFEKNTSFPRLIQSPF